MAVPEICEWKSEHARPLERKRAAVTQPFTRDYNIWPGFGSLSFFFPFFLSGIISHKFRFFDQRRIVVYTYTYIYIYEFAFYPIIVPRFKHRGFGKSTRIMINK